MQVQNGKIFLEIVDSVYVKSKDYSIPVVIDKLGYLDDLNISMLIRFLSLKTKQSLWKLNVNRRTILSLDNCKN